VTVPIASSDAASWAPSSIGCRSACSVAGRIALPPILEGIGHNVAQEAPKAFADAVIEVDRYV
jgi:hypothetical protein